MRRRKSEAKRPLRVEITRAIVRDSAERLAHLERGRLDLCAAANITNLVLEPATTFSIELEFAEAA